MLARGAGPWASSESAGGPGASQKARARVGCEADWGTTGVLGTVHRGGVLAASSETPRQHAVDVGRSGFPRAA